MLLLALTLDTASAGGQRCEALVGYCLTTVDADPVRTISNARERSVNLVEIGPQVIDNAFIKLVFERGYSVIRTRAKAISAITITTRFDTQLLEIMGDPCTLSVQRSRSYSEFHARTIPLPTQSEPRQFIVIASASGSRSSVRSSVSSTSSRTASAVLRNAR